MCHSRYDVATYLCVTQPVIAVRSSHLGCGIARFRGTEVKCLVFTNDIHMPWYKNNIRIYNSYIFEWSIESTVSVTRCGIHGRRKITNLFIFNAAEQFLQLWSHTKHITLPMLQIICTRFYITTLTAGCLFVSNIFWLNTFNTRRAFLIPSPLGGWAFKILWRHIEWAGTETIECQSDVLK